MFRNFVKGHDLTSPLGVAQDHRPPCMPMNVCNCSLFRAQKRIAISRCTIVHPGSCQGNKAVRVRRH